MIDRALLRLTALSLRRPRAVLAATLLPALVSAYAFTVPLDFSFSSVMDRQHPEVARYFAASARYGLGGRLPLLLEGAEPVLDEALLEVQLALDDLDEVRSVVTAPPREWLLARAPWMVDRTVFDSWVELAKSPANLEASRSIRRSLEDLEARRAPTPPEGSRLVVITMKRDTFELALDADDFPTIRGAVEDVLKPLGVTGHFAGMPAIITQEQEATIGRMRVLGPASLLLVLAILLLVERRPAMLASVAFPMLLSVGCTLGIIGLTAGKLTLMESVFGVIVFGLGIDFAIHLLSRLHEERIAGRDFATSVQCAIAGTGRGIVAGAVTTGGAFLILALAPDPVFYRLGLAGGLGLLLCLVFLLVLLPAEWAWIEARSPARAHKLTDTSDSYLARIADLSSRRPVPVLVLGTLLLAWGAAAIPSLRYETNLERVFSRDIAAVDTAKRVHELFGVDPSPWLVAVKELDDARELTRAFEADPVFDRAESLAFLFPEDLAEREGLLNALAPELAQRIRERELAAMKQDGAEGDAAREALEPLSLLLRAQSVGPPERDLLPETLATRFLGPGGELLVYAFAAEPALDSAVAAKERRSAQAIHPEATSMTAIYEALIGTNRPWMKPIVFAVAAFIALVLFVDLRSARLVFLALTPVIAATAATLGVLAEADFSFNTVTLVAVPLLLGLGVDDGIHVIHRMLEQPHASLRVVVGSVARSILLTTLTTCGSVGLLVFTRHPGIESVAILLLVGLPLCLLASVTLLPAAMVVLDAQSIGRRRAQDRAGQPA